MKKALLLIVVLFVFILLVVLASATLKYHEPIKESLTFCVLFSAVVSIVLGLVLIKFGKKKG